MNSQMTPYQMKTAILFDDLLPISPSNSGNMINRYYVNGTVARFVDFFFQSYIVQPTSMASDMI